MTDWKSKHTQKVEAFKKELERLQSEQEPYVPFQPKCHFCGSPNGDWENGERGYLCGPCAVEWWT